MTKVLFITEYLNPPFDEGIKKTVYNLFLELDKNYELQVICRYGFIKDNIQIIDSNPLFFSKEVKIFIKNFKPDALIYLPFQSSTFASYLRFEILSNFANGSRSIFIALQPKPLKNWQKIIVKYIKPGFALTPSPALQQFWNKLKINNQLIPLLTDLTVFKPVNDIKTKLTLRKKYKLPRDSFIISHMGHLNEGRNLRALIPLQKRGIQIVIVGSSSTPEDAKGKISLKDELLYSEIIIIDRFIENIEEIYQLSDIYIFPVVAKNSSIGMPLSILEARACGIPVVTTDYGSIKHFLDTDYAGITYSKSKYFLSEIIKISHEKNSDHIKTNVKSLNKIFKNIIQNAITS